MLAVGHIKEVEFAALLDVTRPNSRNTYLVGRFEVTTSGKLAVKQTSTFTRDSAILWAEWSDFGVFYSYMNGPIQVDLEGRVEDLRNIFGTPANGEAVLAMTVSSTGSRYLLRGPDRSDGTSAVSFELQYSDSRGTQSKRLSVGPVTLANGHTSDLARGRLLCTSDHLYVFAPGGKVFITDFILSYLKTVVDYDAWKWLPRDDVLQAYWYVGATSRSSVLCGYGAGAWLISDDDPAIQTIATAAVRSPLSKASFLGHTSSIVVVVGQGETTAPLALSLLAYRNDVTFQTPIPGEIIAKLGVNARASAILPTGPQSTMIVFSTGQMLGCSIQLDVLGLKND